MSSLQLIYQAPPTIQYVKSGFMHNVHDTALANLSTMYFNCFKFIPSTYSGVIATGNDSDQIDLALTIMPWSGCIIS